MYYISPYALYKLVKQLFHDVNDVNDMTLYAYRENKCWKIGFSNEYIDQIPDDSINISYEFKDGFLKNSPQQATEEIIKSLRRYEQDRISI
ncbi:hypothetical protein B5E87_13045 [Massilimicrobiota sp. An142]|uniref:hypothetical protein n=1 Tax=Bacillota TaxID=1239 RepID=UPI000B38EEED|nr:hypothetical protein [Massilimicrobiota sp. An142]OUQ10536.1 hypothetical protein B5E87_13045 [Massilimicrobiota sp. An142]